MSIRTRNGRNTETRGGHREFSLLSGHTERVYIVKERVTSLDVQGTVSLRVQMIEEEMSGLSYLDY